MDESFTPHPSGTLVLGRYKNGLWIRERCRWHIFRVYEATRVEGPPWWVQHADCLVCEDTTPTIDADAWHYKATDDDVVRCFEQLAEDMDRLRRAVTVIEACRTGPLVAMKDFG